MKYLSSILLNIKISSGQSLIEIIVAMGALAALLTVTASSIIGALSNSQEAKFQNQASIYAQQGVEILRQIRDSDWGHFNSLSGVYCMADTCNTLTANGACGKRVGSCGKNVDIYRREVDVDKNNPQCSQAGNSGTKTIVSVSWNDQKCSNAADFCRSVKLETCFSNLYGNSGL